MRITVAFVLSLIGAGSASNIVARGGYDGWKPKTKEPHFFQLKVDEYEYCSTYSLDAAAAEIDLTSASSSLAEQAAAAAAAAAAAPVLPAIENIAASVLPAVAPVASVVASVAAPIVGTPAAAAPPASTPVTPAAGVGALPAPPTKRQFQANSLTNTNTYFCFKNYAIRLNKGVVIATPYSKFWDPPLATFFVDDDTQLYTVSKKPLQLYVDAVTGQLKYTRVGWLPPNSISISFYHTGDNPLSIVNGNSPSLLTWPSTPGIAIDDGTWQLCPDGSTGQFTVYVNKYNFESQGTTKTGCFERKLAAVNANPWKKKSHHDYGHRKYNDGYEEKDYGYDSGYDNEYGDKYDKDY